MSSYEPLTESDYIARMKANMRCLITCRECGQVFETRNKRDSQLCPRCTRIKQLGSHSYGKTTRVGSAYGRQYYIDKGLKVPGEK